MLTTSMSTIYSASTGHGKFVGRGEEYVTIYRRYSPSKPNFKQTREPNLLTKLTQELKMLVIGLYTGH